MNHFAEDFLSEFIVANAVHAARQMDKHTSDTCLWLVLLSTVFNIWILVNYEKIISFDVDIQYHKIRRNKCFTEEEESRVGDGYCEQLSAFFKMKAC